MSGSGGGTRRLPESFWKTLEGWGGISLVSLFFVPFVQDPVGNPWVGEMESFDSSSIYFSRVRKFFRGSRGAGHRLAGRGERRNPPERLPKSKSGIDSGNP